MTDPTTTPTPTNEQQDARDERAVATVARAVLATPADWPGPDREQEWAEHIARAALAAAHAETERLRVRLVAAEATAQRHDIAGTEARAALAALRKWVGLLADDLERPDASTLAVKRVVAERLRAALAAAASETEEGR